MVSGCVLRKRRAAMVEGIRLPPKELRALGRLNYVVLVCGWGRGRGKNDFYDSDFVLDAEFNIGVLVLGRHGFDVLDVAFAMGIARIGSWE
jgi:hypothetical protein